MSTRNRLVVKGIGAALVVTGILSLLGMGAAGAASASAITGALFEDANRNGVRDAGEAGFGGRSVYVFDAVTGLWAGGAATQTDGSYAVTGLAAGTYKVAVANPDWISLRDTWVPTTTGSVWFRHDAVSVADAATSTATFGLRRIVTSTTIGAPISAVTAADGVRVESYTDAITAGQVRTALDAGSLRGGEAATTVVRFGYGDTNYTVDSVSGTPGSYSNFSAVVWVSYGSWLEAADTMLFHEYGHAWAAYHDTIARQDGTFSEYLDARGLTGNPNLGTSHAWTVDELIAEDYRQLFGSSTASAQAQENTDLPAAAAVAGLESFLRDSFTQPVTVSAPASGGSTSGGASGGSAPAPAPAMAIADLAVSTAQPTVVVSFSLNLAATIDVRILDDRGRTIRTLRSDAAAAAGPVSVTWDRVDDRGRVRDGKFSVEVVATDGATTATATGTFTLLAPSGDGSGGTSGGKGSRK